jgi:hypothetical protein
MEYKESLLKQLERDFSKLEGSTGLSFEEIVAILKSRQNDKTERTIPVSVFDNTALSALEAIVKYMKEDLGRNYKEIAFLLNRNYGPIAITYRNSLKKMKGRLDASSETRIPLSIFENSKLSVLENIVKYLKEDLSLTYHEIAIIMRRDDRTIWTVYNRSLRKRK